MHLFIRISKILMETERVVELPLTLVSVVATGQLPGTLFLRPWTRLTWQCNGLETKISRISLDVLYLGHDFFVIFRPWIHKLSLASHKKGQYVLAGMITCCLRKIPSSIWRNSEVLSLPRAWLSNWGHFSYIFNFSYHARIFPVPIVNDFLTGNRSG